ncbi:type VII secretion-associated serine protease mycosin [Streptomyces caatingaensis]|uniref:type VII secretion-associated serine protease mycosin n=1 Tax=Streptomyces caatingaensis TaxID=1678637 RepID=UPI00099C4005|nr:type VII secretion-associated serine protease mycosin [Streptomyces caatingaensis]
MRRDTRLGRGLRSGALHCAAALFLLAFTTAPAHADTVRERQWHLDGMHAEEMWRTSTGSGVTVAVIDTGVDADLPDLEGQVLPGKDFSGAPGDSHTDYDGHGTAMAVLIAGTGRGFDGRGAKGLAPGAKVLPLRVDTDQSPKPLPDTHHALARAIRYAADSEARIINISLANIAEIEAQSQALDYALEKGKLVFAGVGNSAQKGNPILYPAAHKGVVGVGAIDKNATVTAESERGSQVTLAAPGEDMYTTSERGGGVRRGHGTSDASALASASAALLWSVHTDWTANQVLRVLINTAHGPESGAKRSASLGYGVVRPRVALKSPGDPGAADVNPLTGAKSAPPQTSQAPQPGQEGGQNHVQRDQAPRADTRQDEGGSAGKWVALGAGALVCIGIAVIVPLLRARNRRRSHREPGRDF